jgi:glycosyltransferase involved in cell wall biosynthesis
MRVVTIIPAYNEEATVANVVQAAAGCSLVSEVIVVCDGSVDRTSQRAREAGAIVLDLKPNRGKGGAMKAGLDYVIADVLLFLDADLVGLTSLHVESLLLPVVEGSSEMTIGVFDKGRLATDLAQKIAPFLSGQRAVRWSLLQGMPDFSNTGWGVEVALSKYVRDHDITAVEIPLLGVTQITKEEKLGLIKGLSERLKMYWQIIKVVGKSRNSDEHVG